MDLLFDFINMFGKFERIIWEKPYALGLVVFIPLYWLYEWFLFRRAKHSYIKHSLILKAVKPSILNLHDLKMILRSLFLLCLISAYASPMGERLVTIKRAFGMDIALILDLSASMKIKDFKPHRLFVAKKTIEQFINARHYDALALVAFSGEAYIATPLTYNYQGLKNELNFLNWDQLAPGTAIGDALISGINALKNGNSSQKVLILLTDGDSNVGSTSPKEAAKIAASFKMKLYTIAIGLEQTSLNKAMAEASGLEKLPSSGPFAPENPEKKEFVPSVNLELLKELSRMTGGNSYYAAQKESLEEIFAELNRQEKTRVEEKSSLKTQRLFVIFIILALIFFVLDLLLEEPLWSEFP